MSFLDPQLIPTLVIGEFVGTGITYIVLKFWQKRNFGDAKKEKADWEAKMNAVGDRAVEKIQTWFKAQEEEAGKQPPPKIDIDAGPIVAQISSVIDSKLESMKMSELGKISGMVRGTQAAQVALASESNPRLMGIMTGLGLSKKEAAAIMMAMAESGAVPGFAQASNRSNGQSSLPGI